MQQLCVFSVAGIFVPVREGGFHATDREGRSSEFLESTNEKACCLAIRLTQAYLSTLKMVPDELSVKFCSRPKCVLQLDANRGHCVLRKRATV